MNYSNKKTGGEIPGSDNIQADDSSRMLKVNDNHPSCRRRLQESLDSGYFDERTSYSTNDTRRVSDIETSYTKTMRSKSDNENQLGEVFDQAFGFDQSLQGYNLLTPDCHGQNSTENSNVPSNNRITSTGSGVFSSNEEQEGVVERQNQDGGLDTIGHEEEIPFELVEVRTRELYTPKKVRFRLCYILFLKVSKIP